MIDNRLVGATAENIFLSLVNQQEIFAISFDTAGLDGIVFDLKKKLFKVGDPPYYVQIKCRGADGDKFNPQGHSQIIFDSIIDRAKSLHIAKTSLYFVAGFFNKNDIRNIKFFSIPFSLLSRFKKGDQEYRFSLKVCEGAVQSEDGKIFCL